MSGHAYAPDKTGFACQVCGQPEGQCIQPAADSDSGQHWLASRDRRPVAEPAYDPGPVPEEPQIVTGAALPGHSWKPLDLTAALDGGNTQAAPVLLARDDGACLLYNGKVHTGAGESESLKTWLVLLACATVINDGYHALFIDYEDSAEGIVSRLVALGCPREAILTYFHYVRPEEPYGPPAAAVLAGPCRSRWRSSSSTA